MSRSKLPRTGSYVMDTTRGVIGQVMDYDHDRTCFQLRPPKGGLEWDANPDDVRPATDRERLNAKVQEANSRAWWSA